MAVTMGTQQQIGDTVILNYSSDLGGSPTFYIYQDGILIAETEATQYTITIEAGAHYQIEILDSETETPAQAFPGYATLTWDRALGTGSTYFDNAAKYRIDEYVSSAWVERVTIDDQGEGFFEWTSRFLEDQTTHQFRIVPIGANGIEGRAVTKSIAMVRRPDKPTATCTYNDPAGTVSIVIS